MQLQLYYTRLRYTPQTTLHYKYNCHYTTLQYTTLGYTTLYHTTVHNTTVPYTTLH